MFDFDDLAVHMDGAAHVANPVAGDLPHLAGAQSGVLELLDQRLDDLALTLAGTEPAGERGEDGVREGKPLDPLGGPVGGDLAGGHAPDLLGVRLEERPEELAAEPV